MVCLLVLNSAPLSAQFETASVLGYVRDASGAILPNATVSLVNQETKSAVTAKTNAQGAYEFTDVKVGEYQVTTPREVENPPLNARAYADLAALVPGVRRNLLENTTDSSRDASFDVNGQRSEFNNFLLDGLDNNAYGTSNQGFSNQAIPPSPDAIDEFRVETDNYSAEYRRR